MATVKPRINVTFEPHVYQTIKDLAELNGGSMSSVVSSLFTDLEPALQRLIVLGKAIKQAEGQVKEGMIESVEKAEKTMLPAVADLLSQYDMFTDEFLAALGVSRDGDPR